MPAPKAPKPEPEQPPVLVSTGSTLSATSVLRLSSSPKKGGKAAKVKVPGAAVSGSTSPCLSAVEDHIAQVDEAVPYTGHMAVAPATAAADERQLQTPAIREMEDYAEMLPLEPAFELPPTYIRYRRNISRFSPGTGEGFIGKFSRARSDLQQNDESQSTLSEDEIDRDLDLDSDMPVLPEGACTACGELAADELVDHPELPTKMCLTCERRWERTTFRAGGDGVEDLCRWCGDGGEMLCCDSSKCQRGYCNHCVVRNFGPRMYQMMRVKETWRCFYCDQSLLLRASGQEWRERLVVGYDCECLDSYGRWFEAKVMAVGSDEFGRHVEIHFKGWNDTWDETVSVLSERLRPIGGVMPRSRAMPRNAVQPVAPIAPKRPRAIKPSDSQPRKKANPGKRVDDWKEQCAKFPVNSGVQLEDGRFGSIVSTNGHGYFKVRVRGSKLTVNVRRGQMRPQQMGAGAAARPIVQPRAVVQPQPQPQQPQQPLIQPIPRGANPAGEIDESSSALQQQLAGLLAGIWKARDGSRERALLFREPPSRRDYPDYYQVIKRPISLRGIGSRIKRDEYDSIGAFVSDMRLLFQNARTYNSEGSGVYDDAAHLEASLLKALGPDWNTRPPAKGRTSPPGSEVLDPA